jgi:hypothetical protein
LQIDLSRQFRIVVRAFPKARRREIAHAIDAARDGLVHRTFTPGWAFAGCAAITLNAVFAYRFD